MRCKKQLEKIGEDETQKRDWLSEKEQKPINNKFQKIYNPKPSRQIARENIILNDKKLDEEIFIKMTNPYYFRLNRF